MREHQLSSCTKNELAGGKLIVRANDVGLNQILNDFLVFCARRPHAQTFCGVIRTFQFDNSITANQRKNVKEFHLDFGVKV